ncbi:MAG: phosphate ABC transporter ATP-binding protein [Ilumatobacteraceae bacterium]|jgi:phosphate transport system ATP-binding protein|nr:phosphate ABC transporter ATP-binding protein [Ilumatobacteraceae bacterium]
MTQGTTSSSAESTSVGGTALEFRGLETKAVHAWFGKHHALAGVSLTFPERTVTGLIGPSGCGKSTFIRLLNRMHEFIPTAAMAGSVLLNGKDIYDPSEDPAMIRLKVGMVFQKPNPFPAMTIRENVLAGIKLAHLKRDNHDEIVEKCLTRAGLWNEVKDRLDASGGSLSGGQQQRLCIARSLAVEPQVLLMDEPCSALDPGSTLRIEETIKELAEKITIVIVTHNMQQASRVSDHCAFFLTDGGPGYLVEADSTRKMFTNPSDSRTADYVQGKFG